MGLGWALLQEWPDVGKILIASGPPIRLALGGRQLVRQVRFGTWLGQPQIPAWADDQIVCASTGASESASMAKKKKSGSRESAKHPHNAPDRHPGRSITLDPPVMGYTEAWLTHHAERKMKEREILLPEVLEVLRAPNRKGLPTPAGRLPWARTVRQNRQLMSCLLSGRTSSASSLLS